MPAYVDTGLNFVPVEDAAAGHLLAAERGRVGERYILGGENLTLKQMLGMLARSLRAAGAAHARLPHAVALAAGYVDAAISRVLGREPRIPLDGVRMARHSMFVNAEKARRELGFAPGPGGCGARARGTLVSKQTVTCARTSRRPAVRGGATRPEGAREKRLRSGKSQRKDEDSGNVCGGN